MHAVKERVHQQIHGRHQGGNDQHEYGQSYSGMDTPAQQGYRQVGYCDHKKRGEPQGQAVGQRGGDRKQWA